MDTSAHNKPNQQHILTQKDAFNTDTHIYTCLHIKTQIYMNIHVHIVFNYYILQG